MKSYDVIVVGSGQAGLSVALHLVVSVRVYWARSKGENRC